MLRIVLILAVILLPAVPVEARSELEEAKDSALMVEGYLDRLQLAVEDACVTGKMDVAAWKEYRIIRWHARSILHIMIMAVLFYEEAPDEAHRELIAASTLSLMDILSMMDNFCKEKGIDVPPPTLYEETAEGLELQAPYST